MLRLAAASLAVRPPPLPPRLFVHGGVDRLSVAAGADFDARAEQLLAQLEQALDHPDLEVEELSNAMGVLTLALGGKRGVWVINKQKPNAQVWWSSPLSGPKRFAYDEKKNTWISTRDGTTSLVDLLSKEIKLAAGVDISILV